MQKSLSYLRLDFPSDFEEEKGKLIQITKQQNEKKHFSSSMQDECEGRKITIHGERGTRIRILLPDRFLSARFCCWFKIIIFNFLLSHGSTFPVCTSPSHRRVSNFIFFLLLRHAGATHLFGPTNDDLMCWCDNLEKFKMTDGDSPGREDCALVQTLGEKFFHLLLAIFCFAPHFCTSMDRQAIASNT